MTYSPWTYWPLESFLATWLLAIFACRVTSLPLRSTTIGTVLSGLARIRSESVFQSSVRTPSKETILSPALRPAAAAGEAGSDFLQFVAVLALGDDALGDRADRVGLLGDAEAHEDGEEQRHGEDQVHEGAREHHDDALPGLAGVEEAVLVAGLEFLEGGRAGVLDHAAPGRGGAGLYAAVGAGREHADHADVAAEGDGLDAVLGVALLAREDRSGRSRPCTAARGCRTAWRWTGAPARATRSRPAGRTRRALCRG